MRKQAPNIELRPAESADCPILGKNLSTADVFELGCLGHSDPVEAVYKSLAISRRAWTAIMDGEIVCMFGVAESEGKPFTGIPWLLATEDIKRAPIRFFLRARTYVSEMLELYPYLCNWVYAENKDAHQWIRMLGFVIDEPESYGVNGEPFCLFSKEGKNYV